MDARSSFLSPFSLLMLVSTLLTHVHGLLEREAAQRMCEQYSPLYANIDKDLGRWQGSGISLETMQATIRDHAAYRRCSHSQKGFAAGFRNGTAVLLEQPELATWPGHHMGIWFTYMRALLHLEDTFGALIPDVDFVISTIDRPLTIASTKPGHVDQPVFRFCKTEVHADILVPCFHFYVEDMVPSLISQRSVLNRKYPWSTKRQTVFGRFSPYMRHLHVNDSSAYRLGAGGLSICTSQQTPIMTTIACRARQHFVEWSRQQGPLFDVSLSGRMAMAKQAQFKYLVHLDGQGLSSRLEQLLPLGSLVFKEESGYRGFYHSLMQPYVHYVPFWKKQPEDILEGLAWAQQHDEQAMQVARNGQEFARRYFSSEALSCYWLQLLTRFSKLLRYKPGKGPGRDRMQFEMPIRQYLETSAKQYDAGRYYKMFKFSAR